MVAILVHGVLLAEEPPRLQELREIFQKEEARRIKPLLKSYRDALEKLEKETTQNGDLDAALAVRREKQSTEGRLAGLTSDETPLSSGAVNEQDLRKRLLTSTWWWCGRNSSYPIKFSARKAKIDGLNSYNTFDWSLLGKKLTMVSSDKQWAFEFNDDFTDAKGTRVDKPEKPFSISLKRPVVYLDGQCLRISRPDLFIHRLANLRIRPENIPAFEF